MRARLALAKDDCEKILAKYPADAILIAMPSHHLQVAKGKF